MKKPQSFVNCMLSFAVVLVAFAQSCDKNFSDDKNSCPSKLVGTFDAEDSGVRWGGDQTKVEASIKKVVLECLPVHNPAIETRDRKRGAFTSYRIAATATVIYEINDKAFFEKATRFSNLEAKIIFEAVTLTGVVLGTAEGSFRVVQGGNSGTVSAEILGLSAEEIVRVTAVKARWKYGR